MGHTVAPLLPSPHDALFLDRGLAFRERQWEWTPVAWIRERKPISETYPTSAGLSRRIQQALHTAKSVPGTTTFSQMCGRCESQPSAQAWKKNDLLCLHLLSILSHIAPGLCNSGFCLPPKVSLWWFGEGLHLPWVAWGGGMWEAARIAEMPPASHTHTHGNMGPAQMPCAAIPVPLCSWLPGPSLRHLLPGFRLWCLMVNKGSVP